MTQAILVTGGAGFIGSNFVPYFCRKYPQYYVVNLDKLTYAGNLDNVRECIGLPNYEFIQGDICDADLLTELFYRYDLRGVIHFAAESHVDNSITGPKVFVSTNVEGTFNLLAAAYEHWMNGPHQVKPGYEHCRFHHISTDEVYGSLGPEGFFTETTPYAPNSPYSASKASSDLMVRAYFHTYSLNVTTSNCSNNYGPKQHREKLIPKTIERCLNEQSIPIYGNGLNVRDWLYVGDHCRAIDQIFHQGRAGETYNVGGRNEQNNLNLVQTICTMLDRMYPRANGHTYAELITYVSDRPGHDLRYAIDPSKIERELGWRAQVALQEGLTSTIQWYLASHKQY